MWRTYFQKLTKQPSPGVFVDVGAGDGRFMSNTAFLEGYHCWRGVAVEPTDNEYPKLEKNRPGATTVSRVMPRWPCSQKVLSFTFAVTCSCRHGNAISRTCA